MTTRLAVLTAPVREGISPALYDAMCRAIDAAEALTAFKAAGHSPGFAIPSLPGVYVFDGFDGVLYVGESRNLRRRLLHHERGYLRRSIGVRCRVIPCSNHKQVERWLIAALQPSLNGISEQRRRAKPRKTTEQIFAVLDDLLMAVPKHADALKAYGDEHPESEAAA